jgi:phosphate transport system substrate-binding protein
VVAAGSGVSELVLRRSAELFVESCRSASITVDAADEADGYSRLCAGLLDLAGVARAPTSAETGSCQQAGIDLVELPLASQSVVLATSRHNRGVGCLSFVDLYALLGGESTGFRRWSDAAELASSLGSDTSFPGDGLDLAGPVRAGPLSDLLHQLVLDGIAAERGVGPGMRSDFDGSEDPEVIVSLLASSEAGLGWLSLPTVNANAGRIKALLLSRGPGEECIRPAADSIADGSYPASRPITIQVGLGPGGASPIVRSFVAFLLGNGYQRDVAGDPLTGYLPLPPERLDVTADLWAAT